MSLSVPTSQKLKLIVLLKHSQYFLVTSKLDIVGMGVHIPTTFEGLNVIKLNQVKINM